MQVVMTSPDGSGNSFRHLKRVDLEFHMPELHHGRDDFVFLYQFLDAAPALEALSLDVRTFACCYYFLLRLIYIYPTKDYLLLVYKR